LVDEEEERERREKGTKINWAATRRQESGKKDETSAGAKLHNGKGKDSP
jgi:hypothetical protein